MAPVWKSKEQGVEHARSGKHFKCLHQQPHVNRLETGTARLHKEPILDSDNKERTLSHLQPVLRVRAIISPNDSPIQAQFTQHEAV